MTEANPNLLKSDEELLELASFGLTAKFAMAARLLLALAVMAGLLGSEGIGWGLGLIWASVILWFARFTLSNIFLPFLAAIGAGVGYFFYGVPTQVTMILGETLIFIEGYEQDVIKNFVRAILLELVLFAPLLGWFRFRRIGDTDIRRECLVTGLAYGLGCGVCGFYYTGNVILLLLHPLNGALLGIGACVEVGGSLLGMVCLLTASGVRIGVEAGHYWVLLVPLAVVCFGALLVRHAELTIIKQVAPFIPPDFRTRQLLYEVSIMRAGYEGNIVGWQELEVHDLLARRRLAKAGMDPERLTLPEKKQEAAKKK
jgi:hypothetical protein